MLNAITKRRLVAAAGGGVLVLLLAAGGVAAMSGLALPPAASTPQPATPPAGTPAPPTFVPPGASRPSYFVRPNFAGRTLHWVQRGYAFSPNTPDTANGKEVNGELWVRVGGDGVPTDLHARYTFADGSFHQEIVQDRSRETVVFEPANAPPADGGCRAVWPSSADALRNAFPPFVDEAALAAAGFARAGGATIQPPATPPLPGVAPLAVHGGAATTGWEKKTVADGITSASRTEVGAEGRVTAVRDWRVDSSGAILGETRTAYGPLEEYGPAAVPASVFALSPQAGEVCHA